MSLEVLLSLDDTTVRMLLTLCMETTKRDQLGHYPEAGLTKLTTAFL
jgi:hypothetical protein